ncbi:hypothetical protein [Nisaea sediminum]|uniref:hypothetical protein n=1 Tax=Nisaea sediminum TaxID=2775867 RepID=UPI00186948AD|nr:hypothetical protein [Nisaea sediminum]
MSALKLSLGLGLAFLLAGCVTVIRGDGTVEGAAKSELLQYAASKGPVLLELKGDNPGLPAIMDRVAGIANGTLKGMDVKFTGDPAQAGQLAYRFVLAFNPAAGVREADLCGAGPARVARHLEATRLLTAFCAGEELLASSIATGPQVSGAEDPDFAQMVRSGISETIRARATVGSNKP